METKQPGQWVKLPYELKHAVGDNIRYVLGNVLVVPSVTENGKVIGEGSGYAVTTCGSTVAIVPIEAEIDGPHLIPGSAMCRQPRKGVEVRYRIDAEAGTVMTPKPATVPLYEGKFPNPALCMLPDHMGEDLGDVLACVRFDANTLAKVANAIDSGGVVDLIIVRPDADGDYRPLYLVGDRGVGLCMPNHREQATSSAGYLTETWRRMVESVGKCFERFKKPGFSGLTCCIGVVSDTKAGGDDGK